MNARSTTMPLSLPVTSWLLPDGARRPAKAGAGSEPDSFETWLFTRAQTEHGPFPDWPYLHDYARALESGRDLVVLKRRQILISWVTAAWFHYRASRNPYHHCAVISAGKVAASKQGRRIVVVANRDGYPVHGVDLIKYPNGSEITVFPSTEHAAVGESLRHLHMDEFAFHPYAMSNLNTARPAVSNSGGQIIITSTANPSMGASGPFVDVWADAADDNRLFYGRWVRPDQGAEFFASEANQPGMSDKVMAAYYPEYATDAFIASEGLVHPEGAGPYTREAAVSWGACKWRVVGIDPGGGDPTAIVPLGVTEREHMHQYGEFYRRGDVDLDAILTYLGQLNNEAPIDRIFVGETGGNILVNTLRRNGYPAFKADMRREGIETVKWVMQQGRLTISPRCKNSLAEFRNYRWAENRDMTTGERYATSRVVDHHADAMDARRYAIMGVIRGLPAGSSRPVTVSLGGNR